MADKEALNVVVAYASSQRQILIETTLPKYSTLEQAIEKSGILQRFNEINLEKCAFGINGNIVERHQVLKNHDRVEIYRPLYIDPMLARRKRAESQL